MLALQPNLINYKMKKVMVLAVAMLTMAVAHAQKVKEADVPSEVKAAFAKKYPDVKAGGWVKEDGNYEVEFDYKKAEMTLVIDPKGTVLETETEIKVSELPKTVLDYCASKYAGKKIKEASRIEGSAGEVTYEAEIEKMDVLFDANGKFLKESKD
jgi:Putative beta-lactamase-inhibitor-like, PepSY-like